MEAEFGADVGVAKLAHMGGEETVEAEDATVEEGARGAHNK